MCCATRGSVSNWTVEPAGVRSEIVSYRPALDGLRAIAVLSVMAYHFGYSWLPGGFLGVDLFFVLSGYLITSLLIHEYAGTGRISLASFWTRRARRLLPALIVLVLAVSAWVYWVAPVESWLARRQDLLWTLFYGANWHFIDTSQDYFAKYSGASPLLHAWSLAIEEQFYLVWPIVFLAMSRLVRSRRWPLVVLCVAMVLASATRMAVLLGSAGLSRAYYGSDGRAQELLVGAALALLPTWKSQSPRAGRGLAWLGATLGGVVIGYLLLLHDHMPFYYHGGALGFALVAAALIWNIEVAPTCIVGRALSIPPLPWLAESPTGCTCGIGSSSLSH